jgi:hypothetical protein
MKHSVTITTPYPTPESVARTYGISARRARRLKEIIEESIAKHVLFHKNGGGSLSKNGAGRKPKKSASVSRRKRTRGKAKSA